MSNFQKITGDEIISEILEKLPQAHEILFAHGLSCATCHLGMHETLRDGALSHGFSEEEVERVVADLNDAMHFRETGKFEEN